MGISKKITSIEPDDPPFEERPVTSGDAAENPQPYSREIDPPVSVNSTVLSALFLVIWLGVSALLFLTVLKLPAHWQNYGALDWAGITGIILLPLILIGIMHFTLQRLSSLTGLAHGLYRAAHELSNPDKTVIAKSKTMAHAVAKQVDQVNEKLNAAVGHMASLEEILETQSTNLNQASVSSAKTTSEITDTIKEQKQSLANISETLDGRMNALSNMFSSHTQQLADTVRMAEQKIKEARISMEGATAKINTASDTVRSNTVKATSTLSDSHEEIKTLGDIIHQRSEELDEVYKKHANDLTGMIEHLREEQNNLGVSLEDRLEKMRDLSLSAQASAESLSEASRAGKETIQALSQSANLADSAVKARFEELEQMVNYSTEHAQSISDKASQRVQDSLEHTRKEIARIEADMAALQNKLTTSAAKMKHNVSLEDEVVNVQAAKQSKLVKTKRKRLFVRDIEEINDPDNGLAIAPPQDQKPSPDPGVEQKTEPDTHLDFISETGKPGDDIIEAIRPTIPPHSRKREKSKGGFSIKNLFSGKREGEDSSYAIVTPVKPAEPKPAIKSISPENTRKFIEDLIGLGFSPNAIVDDGCIIEAANSRVSNGHEEMSRTVANRLKSPVIHLTRLIANDDGLSEQAIAFATQFDQSVEQLGGNREAIRAKLETEDGRAYLLCDAALNYGKV